MIIGLLMRTYYLHQNNILFGYDQARDAYIASEIAQGDLKILGPPVSIGGFYHGVFYYYFIALPYYLSHGNPILPIIFISILNISVLPLVYLTGKILFNDKVGLLSALFYTISFDVIQYSNWLSNPSLAVPFSVILHFGLSLYFFTQSKNLGLVLSAIGYSFCFQSEFFLGYLIIPIIFLVLVSKNKINPKQIFIFVFISLIILSSMIISYFKFGFTFIEGIKNMFEGTTKFSSQDVDFFITLKLFFVRLVENFYRNIFPFKSFFAFIFTLSSFLFSIKQKVKKNQLLFLWTFPISQILILPFGGNNIPYINVGLQLPIIIISSYFLINFFKGNKILFSTIVIILVLSSLITDIKYNPKTQILNDIPSSLNLKNQLNILDYTYQQSKGGSFSINTITTPFWINTLWSYLYQWYGQNNYGYQPSFHGRDQSGHLSYLKSPIIEPENFFLIIEPHTRTYPTLITDAIAYEDSFSKVVEEKDFNGIIVQKRKLTKPFNQIEFVR
ncbi:MAG TPA: glycosyltransferase family 39 protein [Candidatus Woesebacteria bacterium]|nr:glycosyltransferase family 39 protein [Candidatus Shapirobacteria bacterium]HOR02197.1 glycosyltransferase family 39 protein [Candidatus Woesebacteria bacterium]